MEIRLNIIIIIVKLMTLRGVILEDDRIDTLQELPDMQDKQEIFKKISSEN